jgi:hypothetical protein
MLGYKSTTHSEDECSWNADVALDIRPHKERSNQKWREAGPTPFVMVWSYPMKTSWGTSMQCILSRPENIRRESGWPRLTWEEIIKKDLKEEEENVDPWGGKLAKP